MVISKNMEQRKWTYLIQSKIMKTLSVILDYIYTGIEFLFE